MLAIKLLLDSGDALLCCAKPCHAMLCYAILCCAPQATLEAAQEAMMTQAEAMRQVTAERDMLRARLLPQHQPLARSVTAGVDSNGWIAAAYGTDSRPARPSSGGEPHLDWMDYLAH